MSWSNVFESSLKFSETVCVVAPGPRGFGRYHLIPQNCTVIAVSKAVLIPGLRADVWIMNHVQQDWYDGASRRFTGIRVFGRDAAEQAQQPSFGREAESGYYFEPPSEPLGLETFQPVDGCIRIGATTSACAVQLAYNFGARRILLCGVDMSGNGYFDGTENPHPHHGDVWPAAARLNVLLQWLADNRGISVATLSPTQLDLPSYHPA